MVLTSELIVAIMMDGKWYSVTVLRKRLRLYRGIISGLVSQLRNQGYLRRALNPKYNLHGKRPQPVSKYLYQWTGVHWRMDMHRPTKLRQQQVEAGWLRYTRLKHHPKLLRKLLE